MAYKAKFLNRMYRDKKQELENFTFDKGGSEYDLLKWLASTLQFF